MDIPVLDESKLHQLLELDDGRAGLLWEMTGLFKAEGPRRLESLRAAVAAGDPNAAMEAAHALKGASGLMGSERVTALARTIEIEAKALRVPSSLDLELLGTFLAEAEGALDLFLARFNP